MHRQRVLALSFFPTSFSRQNGGFLSLLRERRSAQTTTSIAARARPTEKLITPLSVYTGSRLTRTATKCFSTPAENAKRDSALVPVLDRSPALSAFGGEIAEETCRLRSILDNLRRIIALPYRWFSFFSIFCLTNSRVLSTLTCKSDCSACDCATRMNFHQLMTLPCWNVIFR